MGEVIRRNAAVDDILVDVRTTLRNAQSRGGKWMEIAEARLLGNVAVLDAVLQQRDQTKTELATLEAAVDTQDDATDRLIGRAADDIWNAMGRSASDPSLALMFPGGIGYYTEGSDEEQPERMLLLAELIETVPAPKLGKDVRTNVAKQLRDAAATYRQALDTARPPRQRYALLERVRTALARSLQGELAHLKRLYKAEGLSYPLHEPRLPA